MYNFISPPFNCLLSRQVVFHIEKMEVSNLNEKFELSVFRPSATQCGGKHMDG